MDSILAADALDYQEPLAVVHGVDWRADLSSRF